MNDLKYVLRQLFKGRNNNFTKIISLVFGLGISIIIFITMAHQLSYDNFYPDGENLYAIYCNRVVENESNRTTTIIPGPIAGAIMESFDEVVSATVLRSQPWPLFTHGETRFNTRLLFVDSLFFETLGFEVIQGDPKQLISKDKVFISEFIAESHFQGKDPLGEVILFENETPFTIAGVFKDIPPNSHLEGEILMPMQNLIDIYGLYYGFGGGDSYLGYVRLAPGTDPEVINEKLPSIWPKYWDVEKYEESGFIQRYYIAPIKDVHSGIKQIKQIVTLLGILGFAILLITTFNYVLLAISGLNRRAKGVGVHKFCGASSARIFKLFAYETGILLLFSLFLITLIILALKSNLPSFTHFVNFTNIMIIISVILLIFVIATAIPGLLFASIPAKQIYQKVIGSKKGWKKTLLLVQFSGIAFIVNILIIVFMQYRYSNTIDTGYEMDKIAMIELSALELQSEEEQLLQIETLKQELARLPFVEKVAEAGLSPLDGYSGESIVDTNDNLIFISRMAEIDADYMETLGYELIAGDFANKNGEVVVNEEFVKKMGWKDSPVGKEIRWQGKITGVVKNSISSVYHDIQPILFVIEEGGMSIFVSLTEMTPENMAQLNELVQRLFPESGDEFVWLKSEYTSQHRTIAMIGVLISLAIIILMIITLMGLFGFIADEVRRRNKEIAIRKVFGADSSNIIQLITKSLLDVTLLSLLIGGVAAFFVGRLILQLIAMKIALTPLIFILGSIIVFMIIFLTSRIKTKQMLKRNPVESLQSNE